MANHISHASLPYPIKNARFTIEVPYLDADGDPTDPTTPDTEVSQDAGAFADAAEEVTTISGSNGMGYITLSGAETNNSSVCLAFKVASGPKNTLAIIKPRNLAIVGSGTLSAGSAGGGTLGTILAYDVTGCFIRTTGGTGGGGTGGANNQARRIITYTPSTGAFTVSPNWETTPSTDTTYDVLLPEGVTLGMLKTLNPTTPGNTLDVTSTGEAGIDWGNVANKTTTNALTGTTISTSQAVASVSGAVGSVTGAVGSVTGTAAIATAIWQDSTAGDFTVASSIGKCLYIANVAPGGSGGLLISGSNSGTTTFGALTVTGATTLTGAVSATNASNDVRGVTLLSTGLANVTAWTVNITGSLSGSVGSVTGAVGSVTGSVTISAGSVDAIWDEDIVAAHTTADTAGKKLATAGSAADPWDTALPGAYSAGKAGYILGTNLDAVLSARTLASSAYFDPATDTVANVTTVGSVSGAVGSVTGAVGSVTGNVGGNVVGTVASVVTKTGYALVSTGLDLVTAWTTNITGNLSGSVGSVTGSVGSVTGSVGSVTGSVTISAGSVDAIWDEDIVAAHTTADTAGERVKATAVSVSTIKLNTDYPDDCVYLDPTNGASGTTVGVNGTISNPSDTLANANTIATSRGKKRIRLVPRASFTLSSGGYTIDLDLNGGGITLNNTAALSGTVYSSAEAQGSVAPDFGAGQSYVELLTNTFWENIRFPYSVQAADYCYLRKCMIGNASAAMTFSILGDNGTDPVYLEGCYTSMISGLTFDVAGGADLILDGWYGDFTVANLAAGTTVQVYGYGKVTLAASCTGGTFRHTSHVEVTDSSGGAVTLDLVSEPGTITGTVTLAANQHVIVDSGTVTTVTGSVGSVTGAVGSVTGNVGGNVVGTVASVVTKTGYSLASTGLDLVTAWTVNITGSMSGSVGSVTGAVGSVTGNVGGNVNGNVTGSTGSVVGAVGSVTGSVGGDLAGSVLGNVSGSVGSVTGSVGSVTGSVGSVTGNVGGSTASVTGSVGSVAGNVSGDVTGKVLGGGSGTITGDGVRAASVTGATGSVTGSVGSVVGFTPSNIATIMAVTNKIDTGLVLDGAVYQFTANMQELAPTGGASAAAIAAAVWDEAIAGHSTSGSAGASLIAAGSAGDPWATPQPGAYAAGTFGYLISTTTPALLQAALTAASAVIPESAGTIEGFPDTLTIGDSYVTALNNFIKVYVRDSSATPLTGIGTKNFSDADFEAVLTVSQGSRTSLVTATCTWVPAAGPVEGYVKVEFTTDQTRRATEGSATMQLVFKWDGGIETTIATQPVEWEQRVTRSLR